MEVYIDYDTEDLKQMYKQFLGFFKLNELMKIVFSELSKKCRIPCKQPIKCQEIKKKSTKPSHFWGEGVILIQHIALSLRNP